MGEALVVVFLLALFGVLALSGIVVGIWMGRPIGSRTGWRPVWVLVIPSALVVVGEIAFLIILVRAIRGFQ